ncbi:MAG: response regulator [Bacteroidota bacterium]|nr:response regulator [Bacteroidota bacterium]
MQKLRIILIDDSAEDIELALYTLKKNDYIDKIDHFKDAFLALQYIINEPESALVSVFILLDMNMPGMGGLDFIKRIKADAKTKSLPIAVLTSTTELPDIKESMRLGVKFYIPKPIESEDLDKIALELGYPLA